MSDLSNIAGFKLISLNFLNKWYPYMLYKPLNYNLHMVFSTEHTCGIKVQNNVWQGVWDLFHGWSGDRASLKGQTNE